MEDSLQHYMVIDDDKTNNLICSLIIKKFNKNANVELYLDPEKALTAIAVDFSNEMNPKPIILFLDINMPNMSGFEFLDEFLKLDTEIHQYFSIYMLSSAIEDFQVEAKKYPIVQGFLSKPLKISHLETIWNKQSRVIAVKAEKIGYKD